MGDVPNALNLIDQLMEVYKAAAGEREKIRILSPRECSNMLARVRKGTAGNDKNPDHDSLPWEERSKFDKEDRSKCWLTGDDITAGMERIIGSAPPCPFYFVPAIFNHVPFDVAFRTRRLRPLFRGTAGSPAPNKRCVKRRRYDHFSC